MKKIVKKLKALAQYIYTRVILKDRKITQKHCVYHVEKKTNYAKPA